MRAEKLEASDFAEQKPYSRMPFCVPNRLFYIFGTGGALWVYQERLRSCFDLFEMFFEVKESSFSSRFFSQIAPLSSLEEAVETEVFHSQTFKQTNQNSF